MKILLLGAAGFIGTNLTIELAKNTKDEITLIDRNIDFFNPIINMNLNNVHIEEASLTVDMDFDSILKNQEIVYHLVSTTVPTTSNQHISQELVSNVIFSANLSIFFFIPRKRIYSSQVHSAMKSRSMYTGSMCSQHWTLRSG